MISERLMVFLRCPECRGHVRDTGSSVACEACGRQYTREAHYVDLRPEAEYRDNTKYLDPELHADARHERVSPPLLSAAIRNDMLRTMLAPRAGDRVVDLGCGSGRALVWNRDLGAHLVGVDVSPFFAHEALEQVDLVVGDLRRLPVADGAFTKAFTLDVAEHLTREGLVDMLREANRVLTPSGALFIYTHARKNSRLALGLRYVNRVARWLDRRGVIDLRQERLRKSDHINPLADIPDFRAVAREAGFRVADIRYYTPLVGAVIENLLMRIAEGMMARRAKRRLPPSSSSTGAEPDADGLRAARIAAKERIGRKGPVYAGLRALTAVMKLDILLFSRIETGPFFALLVKE